MSLEILKPPTKTKLFIDDHHSDKVSDKFAKFYEEQKFLDIVLIAGIDNVRVKAHRIIMSVSSDYFMAMFTSTLKDSNSDEIVLQDFDGLTLLSIMEFIYSGTILLHSETVDNILRAADFLQMSDLMSGCCQFMAENLEISNCLGIALYAEHLNYTDLYELAYSFACKNFSEICHEKEFLELDQEQLSKLLSSRDEGYSAVTEEIAFQSIVTWVEHNKADREPLLFELLMLVQFKLLSARFIVVNRHSVCTSVECYELILNWIEWHLTRETPPSPSPSQTTNKCERKKNVLLAFQGGIFTDELKPHMFKSQLNWWSVLDYPSSPKRKELYGMAIINEQLFIVGGKHNGISSASVECLNLNNMEWNELPEMNQRRHFCGVVELDGFMYVVGGCDGPNRLLSVEKFDFSTNKWSYVADLLQILRITELVVVNGLLFAIDVGGGFSMQCYDPLTDKWSLKPFKNECSKYFGCTTVGGYLYTLGGRINDKLTNTVERYNPFNETWSIMTPMVVARSSVKCAVLNHRIVACAGRDNDGLSTRVDEYNPWTNEWKEMASLLECMSGQAKFLSY